MKPFVALIALALPLSLAPAHASLELATKSKCMTCHDMEKKKLGPSFKDISTKYKLSLGCGKEDAGALMTESILKGSKGKWGKVPMPPQKIPAEDAKVLGQWIVAC